MRRRFKLLISLSVGAVILSGCTTVKIPNLDFLKVPEFREDAVNIKDYPKAGDVPIAPTDVRSAKAWDDAAKDIIKERDDYERPADIRDNVTDADVERNIDELRAKAQAYKLDDPQ